MLPVQLLTPALFALLAAVFGILAYRDYRRAPHTPSIARRVWTRIALIFSAVSMLLVIYGVSG